MAKPHQATRSGRHGPTLRRRPTGSADGPSARPEPSLPQETAPARTEEEPGEETRGAPPSSLGLEPRPSAARSGRAELELRRREHHETNPSLTAGDEDADWVSAYSVGDEAPGGDNPTPGQTVVEEVGRALGVEYADGEELASGDKIQNRDRHRWELDPASSEDYPERTHQPRPRRKPA